MFVIEKLEKIPGPYPGAEKSVENKSQGCSQNTGYTWNCAKKTRSEIR